MLSGRFRVGVDITSIGCITYNQMVVQTELADDEIDRIFHALAATTRRDILRRTIEREQSVSMLARDYDMSFAAVQKHVAVLEAAGLVIKRAEGRERLVRADPSMIARARALLDRFESCGARASTGSTRSSPKNPHHDTHRHTHHRRRLKCPSPMSPPTPKRSR